jgi:hypothetical protein
MTINAVDFLLCCTGVSAVVVSGAWSIRLLLGPAPKRTPSSTTVDRVLDEELSHGESHGETGLNDRLTAFQTARYAPTIRRPRPIDLIPVKELTPGEPGGPRVVPQRVLQPRTRPFSVPRQPPLIPPRKGSSSPPLPKPPQDADIIPFPLKQKRGDTTKKD